MKHLAATLDRRMPATYLPFMSGRYEVKPGLRRFGVDFGNGEADRHVFQIDRDFPRYRRAKLDARAERLDRYVLSKDYAPPLAGAVARFVADRLVQDHPDLFASVGAGDLECRITGETIAIDEHGGLGASKLRVDAEPVYTSALDALACQVQEDLAVVSVGPKHHWLSALHVCLPSHWAPADKIGGSFAEIHAPVPGMEPTNQRQDNYVAQMVGAQTGLVRFVWGLAADDRLNHHPGRGSGPPINLEQPGVFVRVERQTIWGLPQADGSLFTIRPYLIAMDEIRKQPETHEALISAVRSMSPESMAYKGVKSSEE